MMKNIRSIKINTSELKLRLNSLRDEGLNIDDLKIVVSQLKKEIKKKSK